MFSNDNDSFYLTFCHQKQIITRLLVQNKFIKQSLLIDKVKSLDILQIYAKTLSVYAKRERKTDIIAELFWADLIELPVPKEHITIEQAFGV